MTPLEQFQDGLGLYMIGATIAYLVIVTAQVARNHQPDLSDIPVALCWPILLIVFIGTLLGHYLKSKLEEPK